MTAPDDFGIADATGAPALAVLWERYGSQVVMTLTEPAKRPDPLGRWDFTLPAAVERPEERT